MTDTPWLAAGFFIQRDPKEYIDSMNLFEYVENNPLIVVDPAGVRGANRNKGWGGGKRNEPLYSISWSSRINLRST